MNVKFRKIFFLSIVTTWVCPVLGVIFLTINLSGKPFFRSTLAIDPISPLIVSCEEMRLGLFERMWASVHFCFIGTKLLKLVYWPVYVDFLYADFIRFPSQVNVWEMKGMIELYFRYELDWRWRIWLRIAAVCEHVLNFWLLSSVLSSHTHLEFSFFSITYWVGDGHNNGWLVGRCDPST
jgi:hypothetical protein